MLMDLTTDDERPPATFSFTVCYEHPVSADGRIILKAGVVFRGRVQVYVGWIEATGRALRASDYPTLDSLGLMLGEGPPRPADLYNYSAAWNTIHAYLGWDIDTSDYADGPYPLTVGDPVWVRHYPDTVAGLVAGGRSISLPVVVANGQTVPE